MSRIKGKLFGYVGKPAPKRRKSVKRGNWKQR